MSRRSLRTTCLAEAYSEAKAEAYSGGRKVAVKQKIGMLEQSETHGLCLIIEAVFPNILTPE